MKKVRYFFEAAALYILFGIFRILPLDTASGLGGWIGRTIGPRLAASRKALRHIEQAMPDLDEQARHQAITDMWENLGRVMAEYPHLEKISNERIEVVNKEILDDISAADQPAIFASAHLANWEIYGGGMPAQTGKPLDLTYRAANNPWTDKLLSHARTLGGQVKTFPKSRESGRLIMKALKDKRFLGILIDQKYNEGVAVPFFDKPAMTNPIFVQLAQKFKCPLIMARGERLGGANFRVTLHGPLPLTNDDGTALPIEDVIATAHEYLESWISERPGQWIWLHRRWSSKALEG